MPTLLFRRGAAPLALVAGCALLGACASTAPKQLPPEPGPATASSEGNARLSGPAPGSAADFVASLMGQDTIHFAFDKYGIDQTAASALQAQAQWLMKYPAKRATIEGHCDERGTRDYNLALGDRRAHAAKDYLVSLGVAVGRLSTVTYGKERPIDPASNEEAWARNRRAVTVTIDQ